MAIGYVSQNTYYSTGTSTTVVITIGVAGIAAGNTIVICCNNETATDPHITGIVDSAGNTYNYVIHAHSAKHDQTEIWYATNVGELVQNNTITVTFEATATFRRATALEFSGLGTAEVNVSSANNSSSATPNSPVTTTVAAAALVSSFINYSASSSATEGAGYTLNTNYLYGGTEYQIASATGTYNGNFVGAANNAWGCVQAAFCTEAGEASATPIPVYLAQYRRRWSEI